MKKNKICVAKDKLRRQYTLSQLVGRVRGKYSSRYRGGTNLVLLSPDVAKYFADDRAVNDALRTLIQTTKRSRARSR
jgi:hypothetical protein